MEGPEGPPGARKASQPRRREPVALGPEVPGPRTSWKRTAYLGGWEGTCPLFSGGSRSGGTSDWTSAGHGSRPTSAAPIALPSAGGPRALQTEAASSDRMVSCPCSVPVGFHRAQQRATVRFRGAGVPRFVPSYVRRERRF